MSEQPQTLSPRTIIQVLIFVLVIPLLPLLISQHWDWWEAWVFAVLGIGGFAVSRALATRRHPDLLAERARMVRHDDTKPWDRILSPLVGLGGGLVPLVAGLDAAFGWSPPFSLQAKAAALLVILAGHALGSYALIENRFFSSVVRIQFDRGHQVVSTGPYRWMRHPGYAGALLYYLSAPVLLDSAWAFLPAAVMVVALVVRTSLEDRALQEELEGYGEYSRQVRYRLVPGVW